MNAKVWIAGLLMASLALNAACDKKPAGGAAAPAQQTTSKTTPVADASGRCPHEIKQEKCPFCNPKLVESEGFCGEHGVPEALCVLCRPYLKAAFRAKGDWCKEHNTPESLCVECHPELKKNIRPGEHGGAAPTAAAAGSAAPGQCEHGVLKAKCPFCTPSLVQSDGYCKEHEIAEALCVRCRPYLEAAFKSKGDWCNEHATPESQCVECHPELKNKPQTQG